MTEQILAGASPERSGAPEAHAESDRGRHRARRSRARWWWLGIGVVLLLVVGVGAWLGIRGYLAYQEVTAARAEISAIAASATAAPAEGEPVGPRFDGLNEGLASVAARTAEARALTGDPIWAAAGAIPFIGSNFSVTRELILIADDVVTAAAPLADIADGFTIADLKPVDGAVPVGVLQDMLDELATFDAAVQPLAIRASALDASGTLPQLQAATTQIADLLGTAAEATAAGTEFSASLPWLLGVDAPRTYVVAFINSAELRPLGGTVLSFAVITIDNGKISLVETVPVGFQNFPTFDPPVVATPDGWQEIYPNSIGYYVPNATIRPTFETAGEIIEQNFIRARGITPDVIVGVNGPALRAVMAATGPVFLSSGDTVNSDTVLPLLLNEVYIRYQGASEEAQLTQDAIYSETVSAVFGQLSNGAFDPIRMVTGMMASFAGGDVSLWTRNEGAGDAFRAAGATNGLPASTPEHETIGVYLNNWVGSKLDFYLESAIDVASVMCAPDSPPTSAVTLTLRHALDPASVESIGEYVAGWKNFTAGQRVMVLVYAPPGGSFGAATLNGEPVALTPLHDEQYPVAQFEAIMAPGESSVITVEVVGASPTATTVGIDSTPTIKGTAITQSVIPCG